MPTRRNTSLYRKARAIMLAHAAEQGLPCYRCGGRIDYALPYKDPATGKVNRAAATADHIARVVFGGLADEGNPANLAPAHQRCNSSDGARAGNAVRGAKRRARKQAP